MMQRLSRLVPNGVKDLHTKDIEQKQQLLAILGNLFRKHKYKQVQTPIFEYYDLFTEIKGTMEKDQMIKLIDTDGKILVLRPDATIPIARMVASDYAPDSCVSNSVHKYSYITSIFRMADDPQNVQSREFTQAGIEFFGDNSTEADVEVISLAIESLRQVGVKDFTIDLGQANFYKALIRHIQLGEGEIAYIQGLIENKNFADLKKTVNGLDIDSSFKNALRTIPTLYGRPHEVLEKALTICMNHEMQMGIKQLQGVFEQLSTLGYDRYLSLDLGLINNLNYYTGILFQGYITGLGKPILLGGRYDELTKQFGYDSKATGFAIYVDDLITALANQNKQVGV